MASEDTAAVLKIFREFEVKGFDPDAFISDNFLASSTGQGVQSFPMCWINPDVLDMIIKTEDDHDDAESAAIQSYTCQPILASVEDNLDFTGFESLGNDCSIHPSARLSSMNTDASYPSATPSSINQNILTDTSFPFARPSTINTDASHPSVMPSAINKFINTDACHPCATPSTINIDAAHPSATPSTINKSIHTNATHSSATQSSINQSRPSVPEDNEQVKRESLNSARYLRSSSLSLKHENVKLRSEPLCVENSRKQDASSNKKNKLTSVIIKAIKKIKSDKKAPNIKRITEVVRKLQPNKESISSKDVLKHLNEAVEQGTVQSDSTSGRESILRKMRRNRLNIIGRARPRGSRH